MNKKRIFGIILFLLIGFFMFTFANPNEKVNDEDKKPKTEEKAKKNKKGIQVIEPTEIDQKETKAEYIPSEFIDVVHGITIAWRTRENTC